MSYHEYLDIVKQIDWDENYIVTKPDLCNGILYPLLVGKRFSFIYSYIKNNIERGNCRIVDIGCFPGALGKILKKRFGGEITLDGVGLGLENSFLKEMRPEIYENLFEVELDPENLQCRDNSKTITIPQEDNYYDIVIASEIFEHLYSPLHFINECRRILKKNGLLILTTPNVSYFGNICRLITGRSNHETLDTSHIYLKSDWRPHMRVYDRYELKKLFEDAGFTENEVYMLDNREDCFTNSRNIKLKMFLIRLFFIFPRFRNQYIGIFKKTV